jgi:hypothetical protein
MKVLWLSDWDLSWALMDLSFYFCNYSSVLNTYLPYCQEDSHIITGEVKASTCAPRASTNIVMQSITEDKPMNCDAITFQIY